MSATVVRLTPIVESLTASLRDTEDEAAREGIQAMIEEYTAELAEAELPMRELLCADPLPGRRTPTEG